MSLPALADFSNVAGGFSFYCLQIPELFQEDFPNNVSNPSHPSRISSSSNNPNFQEIPA
jgi:hypothetical protein